MCFVILAFLSNVGTECSPMCPWEEGEEGPEKNKDNLQNKQVAIHR